MMWDVVLRKMRRTEAVSLAMLRSQNFLADKWNQKPSIGAKRVMHAFCSYSMAWRIGIHGRAEKIDRPDWAHGGLPHRSRECALTAVQQSQWRINDLGMGGRAFELRWYECVWSNEERIAHLDRAEGSEGERQNVCSRLSTALEHDTASERRPCHANDKQRGAGWFRRGRWDQWRQHLRTVDCTNSRPPPCD